MDVAVGFSPAGEESGLGWENEISGWGGRWEVGVAAQVVEGEMNCGCDRPCVDC